MLKAGVNLNDCKEDINSLLTPSSATEVKEGQAIGTNMEDSTGKQCTDDQTKSKNESNEVAHDCDKTKPAEPVKPTAPTHSSGKHVRKRSGLLTAPNIETICDDISSTTEDIKRLKHVQVRSNSTGKLYQSSRRVSFPENDSELVTGYLEPADPWASVKPATCVSELAEFYRDSCRRHKAQPIETIMKHLDTLDLNSNSRRPVLSLREQNLTAESCEALEEVLKRVQYKLIDLTDCGLNDASATALFDIIEYYEAANEIDISENCNITNRGWQACINMVKRSHALQILVTRGTPLSEANAISLGKSMLTSSLNTLKLEHCGLSGRPMASLCLYLRKNTVLKELWLAYNDLTADDAYNIGNILKSNFYLQFLDLSNNNIQDTGVSNIVEALIDQANYFKVLHGSSGTALQPLSSKHTLTRGDKIESKYECLARLINATKPKADTAAKSESTVNQCKPPIVEKPAAEPKQPEQAQEITKGDNNNSSNAPAAAETVADSKVCELQIVEKPDENLVESKSDNDDESSANHQHLESSEANAADTTSVEDNNNASTGERAVLTKQSSGDSAPQTNQTNDDLTENIEQAQVATDCHLDINENKSNMKLNYAEVVKVDSSDSQMCKNFNDAAPADHVDNKQFDSTRSASSDLDKKVQNTHDGRENGDNVKRECSSPKPIQPSKTTRYDDDEMSPVCKVRLPLNSPRLTKSKDILSELPLTPDSSHSLDSSCEYSTSFETIKTYNTSIVPERSFSSESLNSETSIESNDSKSSIKLAEAKFSKNGTLERQTNSFVLAPPSVSTPNGLQVLMLWNNHITRDSAKSVSKLLAATTTLEILNVGKNVLSNDFVANIKSSLKANTSLTSFGLQSVHLSNDGVKTLSEILDFGGNVTLQRVDLRDNNLQVNGLTHLNEVLKSNKSITRIDLDDVPRRAHEHSSDSSIDYNRVVNNIRSLCARNENPPDPEPVRTTVKRVHANFLNSRKISLTCQSIRNNAHDTPQAKAERHLLDPTRKSGSRLRSPSPSPIPSPVSSSPIPSPGRFQVSRVIESNVSSPLTPPSSNSCSPTSTSSSRFRVTVVEPPKLMSAPVTIINSTNKENDTFVQKKDAEPTSTIITTATMTTMTVTAAVAQPLQRTQSAPSTTISQTKEQPTPSVTEAKVISASKPTEPAAPLQQKHIVTTLTVIDNGRNSFDSSDLEVKGYMDDSCSSFSSLDSIDRGQDFNTSFSSIESYDILRENKHTIDTSLGKNLHKAKQGVVPKTASSSSIENVEPSVDNCASSLEASTCSNDSIYGSQEFPVVKISSNEGTLTNSPVSPCSGDSATTDKDSLSPKVDDKQPRVRKTSWITRGDAVPATLDKLLSIFHHPGNFFTRASNGDVPKKEPPQPENKPPSRKESPSGLFAWTRKDNVFDEQGDCKPTAADAAPSYKVAKSPLQSNMSPENTITDDSVGIEVIPIQLKQDVKENTSPEHTVTADSMANLQSKTIASLSAGIAPKIEKLDTEQQEQESKNEKVHFEVGGDDDDDEFEDKSEYTSIPVAEASQQLPTTVNHVGKAFGLGQITRDSLSILKGSSNNSQDSMRSLESLSEIVFEET